MAIVLGTGLGIGIGGTPGLSAYLSARGLAGSVAGADFRRRLYWLPSTADPTKARPASEAEFFAQFAAASTATRPYFDAGGAMRADLAANQPRFSHVGGASRLVLESALTNKLLCRKHNPVDLAQLSMGGDASAVLSLVDDRTALTAAGLSAVCSNGMVYKVSNAAGTTTAILAFNGAVGNTNVHCVQAWMRGTGIVDLRLADASASVSVPLTPNWVQYQSGGGTPTATNMTMRVMIPAGAIVYLILPGLYEQPFAPHAPVIGDTTAAASRTVESFRLPAGLETAMQGSAGTVLVRMTARRTGTSSSDLPVVLGGPAHPIIGARSTLSIRTSLDGTGTLDASLGSGSPLSGLGAAVAWNGAGTASCANAGGVSSSATPLQPAIRSSTYLGRVASAGYAFGDGTYDLVAVWPDRDDARLRAVATP